MRVQTKRDRSLKSQQREKARYLEVRIVPREKKALKDAAELAGLKLSAWIRERLRAAARTEFEAAGLPVPFVKNGQAPTTAAAPNRLAFARYEPEAKVLLVFADGFSGSWSFRTLDLDMKAMKPKTIKAAASGDTLEVRSQRNERVLIDATALRAAVDPDYAVEFEKALLALRGPIDSLMVTAKQT